MSGCNPYPPEELITNYCAFPSRSIPVGGGKSVRTWFAFHWYKQAAIGTSCPVQCREMLKNRGYSERFGSRGSLVRIQSSRPIFSNGKSPQAAYLRLRRECGLPAPGVSGVTLPPFANLYVQSFRPEGRSTFTPISDLLGSYFHPRSLMHSWYEGGLNNLAQNPVRLDFRVQ